MRDRWQKSMNVVIYDIMLKATIELCGSTGMYVVKHDEEQN